MGIAKSAWLLAIYDGIHSLEFEMQMNSLSTLDTIIDQHGAVGK